VKIISQSYYVELTWSLIDLINVKELQSWALLWWAWFLWK